MGILLDAAGLSSAAFSFSQCFDVSQQAHIPYLWKIFRHIRVATIANLPLFQPRELGSIIRTYARWQLSVEFVHVCKVAERLLVTTNQFDTESRISTMFALGQL